MTEFSDPIRVEGLTRRFGANVALNRVDLAVPRGVVFGLVGENGAGKTTLIRHLLGLFKAQSGTVRVFGLDPVEEPERVLARVGYLSEDRALPPWMRVRELMLYTQAFYPGWDAEYAEELRRTFELDPGAKVKHLSRGQRAQAALLIALAYRPELLLLDEPSSGLDPVVRRDILTAIIRTVAEEGRTVLLSSHLLDEVERMADSVAMLNRGRMVFSGPVDAMKQRHRRITVRLAEPRTEPPSIPAALFWEGTAARSPRREWTAICDGQTDEFKRAVSQLHGEVVDDQTPSLEEIFVARVRGGR